MTRVLHRAHADRLVEPEGAGRVLGVHAEPGGGAPPRVKGAKCVQEQRSSEAASPPGAADARATRPSRGPARRSARARRPPRRQPRRRRARGTRSRDRTASGRGPSPSTPRTASAGSRSCRRTPLRAARARAAPRLRARCARRRRPATRAARARLATRPASRDDVRTGPNPRSRRMPASGPAGRQTQAAHALDRLLSGALLRPVEERFARGSIPRRPVDGEPVFLAVNVGVADDRAVPLEHAEVALDVERGVAKPRSHLFRVGRAHVGVQRGDRLGVGDRRRAQRVSLRAQRVSPVAARGRAARASAPDRRALRGG